MQHADNMTASYFSEKTNGYSRELTRSTSVVESPLSPAAVPPRSSALSTKLTSVLSASYADLEIRDALETLDERQVQNNPEVRRQLRLDIQKEVTDCNGAIIQEFGQVAAQLKRIGAIIDSLNTCCDEMRAQISAARKETAPVLHDASALITQRSETETKQQILGAFAEHFLISNNDILALTASSGPVDEAFFTAMSRVKRIHKDCEVLLGTEDQTMGLDIMTQSSKTLNQAFQRLYHWTQSEFKTLDLESPQINSSIRKALRILAEKPTLFQSCLDFFAEAREHILSDSFLTALSGSSDVDTKPIELYAHDPLRYVGDMLAWAHSATVSEREALETLFVSEESDLAEGIRAGIDNEPWNRPESADAEPFNGRKALVELVNRDISGIARTLLQRVNTVLHSYEDSVLLYKLSNLLNFYGVTFQKLLGPESTLVTTLTTLEDSALRQFRTTVRDRIAAVQSDYPQPPPDLSVPSFLAEALDTLSQLLKSFDTSLAPLASREAIFAPIMKEALDPFLAGCETLSKELSTPRTEIFRINCFLTTKITLSNYNFVATHSKNITTAIGEQCEKLVEHQHAYLLHTSMLHPLILALAPLSSSDDDLRSLLSLPVFQKESLKRIAQRLDDFLPSALMDAVDQLRGLQSQKIIQDVTSQGAERFCEDFEFIEDKIEGVDSLADEENEEEGLRDVFPRTSGEIRVLLS